MSGGWRIVPRGEYPEDWPSVALAVKLAAGWRCIRCTAPHSVEGARVLTVHHLNGDKADGRWWNLLALCQRCHLSIQARVNVEQLYLHEHTPWFKPYAAGYYASSILGVELTREQVEARLEELLRVGQPWLAGIEVPGEVVDPATGDSVSAPVLLPAPGAMERTPDALVPVRCGTCGWIGQLLPADVGDHPCPRCGRYQGIHRRRDG